MCVARSRRPRPANLSVTAIDRKQRKRNPAPPFTTSTLQQESARKLGFGAQRTMRLAQQLYEGVDFGEGAVGLITYMRTDSVNLAAEAVQEIRQVITSMYGAESLPAEPRIYKTKSKNAQEAHEAIRPTSAAVTPERLEGKIEPDQLKLYSLIWKRAVASQMEPAVYDTVAVDLVPGTAAKRDGAVAVLRANGSTLVKPGYIAVYKEGLDDASDDDNDRILPPMEIGDRLKLLAIRPEQHFTEPPPRYSEASLVKALEEHGIGRPSTYASIIQTLIGKKYAELLNRRFIPSDLGKIVNRFLTRNFEHWVDYGFTAKMEDDLDEIADGREAWVPVLERFWKEFKRQVDFVDESVTREDVSEAREVGKDPVTSKPISVRYGKYGPFVQLGTKDDEEKPRFASLRPNQRMDQITLADALELFKLPKTLGTTDAGEPIKVAIGRFGPYVQYGAKKFVSVKDDDPYKLELPRALELIRAKEVLDANRIIRDFPEAGIQVLNGRYGPYITDRVKNAKIPKDREPKSLTLEECRELIAAAPERSKRGRFGMKVAAKTPAAQPKTEAPAAVSKPEKPVAKSAKSPARQQSNRLQWRSNRRLRHWQSSQSPVSAKASPKVSVLKPRSPRRLRRKRHRPNRKAKARASRHSIQRAQDCLRGKWICAESTPARTASSAAGALCRICVGIRSPPLQSACHRVDAPSRLMMSLPKSARGASGLQAETYTSRRNVSHRVPRPSRCCASSVNSLRCTLGLCTSKRVPTQRERRASEYVFATIEFAHAQ